MHAGRDERFQFLSRDVFGNAAFECCDIAHPFLVPAHVQLSRVIYQQKFAWRVAEQLGDAIFDFRLGRAETQTSRFLSGDLFHDQTVQNALVAKAHAGQTHLAAKTAKLILQI